MIGLKITGEDGNPLEQYKNLAQSSYQPPVDVQKLFARVQMDYQIAYSLQHRSFDEFDGYSLLQRARLDQQTFGAYVGLEYQPIHKRWRWRGRKNTARNKLIGILAHLLAATLYPFVYAKNEENEEDKMTARVMRILVEEHLRKAKYEVKFLYMALTALVNPAVIVEVEYIQAMQRIKQRLSNGEIKIVDAVDEMMSGLNLNIIPVDELLMADFFTGDLQRQPYMIRVRRISWDTARKQCAGKYFNKEGKDLFDYVEPGKTRVVLTGQEHQTLYDIEWTEADRNYVQEITAYYKDEDLEVKFVGGVFLGDESDVYNSNPFKHRRMTLVKDEWLTIPIYPFAKSGFEPIDPTGRFFYYKSAAFKEYWDDMALNTMHRLALDGTYLDVIKPLFLSGVTKVDSVVMAPGATVGMPQGATVTPYQLGPNLTAAYNAIMQQEKDLSESTQDKIMSGNVEKGVTAYATQKAEQNARIFLGVFGLMIADLIQQVGELTVDCIIQYETVGEVDASVPEALNMKYRTFLAKGKDHGKDITNRIVFSDQYMGREVSEKEKNDRDWELYNKTGKTGAERYSSDQRIYEVNPYKFARYTYSMFVDVDQILRRSIGSDRQRKMDAFNVLTDQRVVQFTDAKSVAGDIIEEFGIDLGADPEKYKAKVDANEMMGGMMGGGASPPAGGQVVPPIQPTNNKMLV